jgi:hypothetical protein
LLSLTKRCGGKGRLTVHRNEALIETAGEVSSGLIDAEEVYGAIHSLGCDWETLMVVHVDGVSQIYHTGDEERKGWRTRRLSTVEQLLWIFVSAL